MVKQYAPASIMTSFASLIKSDWRMLLFGFLLMFFSSPGQTYFISLFSGEIRSDLGLSHGQFGAIYSIATLSSAFALLWTGTLLDRIDLKTFSIGLYLCLAATCVLMSLSSNVVMLCITIFLLRQLGQGLTGMTSATSMMRYVEKNKAKANSISSMGYSASEAVIPSVLIFLLLTYSWRESWLIAAAALLIIMPLSIWFLLGNHKERHRAYLQRTEPDPTQQHALGGDQSTQRQWTRAQVLHDPLFYLFAPSLVSQSMLFTGFMFHQVHLVDQKGWSLIVWGKLYLLFATCSIITNLSTGALIDKVGATKITPLIMLPMACGLLLLSSSSSILIAALFMILMAVSCGMQAATTAPFFSERYGNQHFGAIKSLATFTMVLMSGVSPVAMGWAIDLGTTMDQLAIVSAAYAIMVAGLAGYAIIQSQHAIKSYHK